MRMLHACGLRWGGPWRFSSRPLPGPGACMLSAGLAGVGASHAQQPSCALAAARGMLLPSPPAGPAQHANAHACMHGHMPQDKSRALPWLRRSCALTAAAKSSLCKAKLLSAARLAGAGCGPTGVCQRPPSRSDKRIELSSTCIDKLTTSPPPHTHTTLPTHSCTALYLL